MKIKLSILCLLSVIGCSPYPSNRIAIVHDYIIKHALKFCNQHSGLHYIVSTGAILEKGRYLYSSYDFPCRDTYRFRCQDDTLSPEFDSGAKYCFISESQIEESR